MILEKAIEIETIHNDHNPNFADAERREAHQLLIEAGKAVLEIRHYPFPDGIVQLPGETIN